MSLKLRFKNTAVAVISDAIEFAQEGGEIQKTRYKMHNGDIFLDIPVSEIDLWLEVFDGMLDLLDETDEDDREDFALLRKVRNSFEQHANALLLQLEDDEDGVGAAAGAESGSAGESSSST